MNVPGCCTQSVRNGQFFTPCIIDGIEGFFGETMDCVPTGFPDCDVDLGCVSR
ncbi:MAG: hypothetical protein ABI895_04255 [Deltaproteobacteria bacterium]